MAQRFYLVPSRWRSAGLVSRRFRVLLRYFGTSDYKMYSPLSAAVPRGNTYKRNVYLHTALVLRKLYRQSFGIANREFIVFSRIDRSRQQSTQLHYEIDHQHHPVNYSRDWRNRESRRRRHQCSPRLALRSQLHHPRSNPQHHLPQSHRPRRQIFPTHPRKRRPR